MNDTGSGSAKASGKVSGSAVRGGPGVGGAARFRFDIPDEHALWLGRFIAEMSTIEHALEALIWDLAGIDPAIGCLFTRRMGARHKAERIQELLELRKASGKAQKTWKDTQKLIRSLAESRGHHAHAPTLWAGFTPLMISTRLHREGDGPYGVKPVPLEDMKRLTAAAMTIRGKLDEMHRLL